MSNFDGPDKDVPGIDEATDEDWRRFTRQLADRLFVMFDHNHRVALIAQIFQRDQQPIIIALVQTN